MATLPVVLPGLLEETVGEGGVTLPIVMPLVLAAETTGAALPTLLPFVLDAGVTAPSGLVAGRGYFLFDGMYRLLTPDAPIISTSVLPTILPFVLADPIITGPLVNGDTLSGGTDAATSYTDTYSGGTDAVTTYTNTIDGTTT